MVLKMQLGALGTGKGLMRHEKGILANFELVLEIESARACLYENLESSVIYEAPLIKPILGYWIVSVLDPIRYY
jgi:hypothetical protein